MRALWGGTHRRAVVAGVVGLALAAAPAQAGDRRVRVSGWLVADVAEDDGGQAVSLVRRDAGLVLEYRAIFWRGNDGIVHDVVVQGCAGETFRSSDPALVTAASVRERFAAQLAGCGTPAEQADRALEGFEGAFQLGARWSGEAARARTAEIEAIIDHGAGEEGASPPSSEPIRPEERRR